MKGKCINNDSYEHSFINGDVYEILSRNTHWCQVNGMIGVVSCFKERFEIIEEEVDMKKSLKEFALIKFMDNTLGVLLNGRIYRKDCTNKLFDIAYVELNEYDDKLNKYYCGKKSITCIKAYVNLSCPTTSINEVLNGNEDTRTKWDWVRNDNTDKIAQLEKTIELATQQIKELKDSV